MWLGLLREQSAGKKERPHDQMDPVIDLAKHQGTDVKVSLGESDDPQEQIDQAEESAKAFRAAERSSKAKIQRNYS